MISIKVKNASDVVQEQKGWFVAKTLNLFGMSEFAVEKIIAHQLERVLLEQGVNADIKVTREQHDKEVTPA